jgi:hypothetical protein
VERPEVNTPVRSSEKNMTEQEPKLRHEFVGMMFAVAIGEVGLQTATLVQAGHWVHFLPAYSHLTLATVLIATSWVGWTLSPSPGARADVNSVFEWEFCVLLIDVLLVVTYFILVRSVDITEDKPIELKASAAPEAFWIFFVFCVYLIWDIFSKVIIYRSKKRSEAWFSTYGVRIVPTALCVALAYSIKRTVGVADPPHVLTADLAMIGLLLLFRSLKDLASSLFPKSGTPADVICKAKRSALGWSSFFAAVTLLGILWTRFWPIPKAIAGQILRTNF